MKIHALLLSTLEPQVQRTNKSWKGFLVQLRVFLIIPVLAPLIWAQVSGVAWLDEVRRLSQVKDWAGAIRIVDQELASSPEDTQLKTWHARLLLWSGQVFDAEREYHAILLDSPDDPDSWVGLANVYMREGRTEDANQVLQSALALDPSRPDIHIARARVMQATKDLTEARIEFLKALNLEPNSAEARLGLRSLAADPKHELRLGASLNLFSFTTANSDQEISLASRWNPHFRTYAGESFYRFGDINAEKVTASVTGTSHKLGAATIGGAVAHDAGIVPQHEFFFDYDRGWSLGSQSLIRGVEIETGPHWYWYRAARILTINETVILYLPNSWMWSFGLTTARSAFFTSRSEWRPSGMSRLTFPIIGGHLPRLTGNAFFAAGTENFSRVDQIGHFSSQTYGGGLRLELTRYQNVTGTAAYQKRTQDRTETGFGFQYGIRF